MMQGDLGAWTDNLRNETAPLRPFRDPNFLERLAALEREEPGAKSTELDFGEDGSLQYASADKLVELVVSGKGKGKPRCNGRPWGFFSPHTVRLSV